MASDQRRRRQRNPRIQCAFDQMAERRRPVANWRGSVGSDSTTRGSQTKLFICEKRERKKRRRRRIEEREVVVVVVVVVVRMRKKKVVGVEKASAGIARR